MVSRRCISIEDTMDLSKIHDCEKCHGRIVSITLDHVGLTRCGYCNEVVDYSPVWKDPEFQKKLKEAMAE